MKSFIPLFFLLCMMCAGTVTLAAPVPQIGPMTIEGTIREISWSADRFVRGKRFFRDGKWYSASGSLGRDRTIPARYTVTLTGTTVVSEETADTALSFRSGTVILAVLNHPRDDRFLRKGMRIIIRGYTVRGDEGGDWYSCSGLTILRRR